MSALQATAVSDNIDMGTTLAAAKQQLRGLMKQKLSAIPQETVARQSAIIFKTLQGFRPYVDARRVSVFLSMPSGEVQTDAIVRHSLSSGKEVFVPYLHRSPLASPNLPARVMDMVQLRDLADYESLQRDRWGIPSIDPSTVHERRRILGGPDAQHSDRSTLDLMLMPGVAFDVDPRTGLIRRCGHGKGFYDFFIHRYGEKLAAMEPDMKTPVLLYGLSLSEQFLPPSSPDLIPAGPLDRPLDGLISGDGEVQMRADANQLSSHP